MPSTDFLDAWEDIGLEDADPKVDIYASFGYDAADHQECNEQNPNAECQQRRCTCSYTSGLAGVGVACKDHSKNSMNEYAKTPVQSAWVH